MAFHAIDPDVARIAKRFAGSSKTFPQLIQAAIQAEGGKDRILTAVRCSVPTCKDTEEAIEITCRSALHAMSDYVRVSDPENYVAYWAGKWAPRGVANDPTDLNVNWPGNVLRGWLPSPAQPPSIGNDVPGGGAS